MNKKQFLKSLSEVYCRIGRTKHGVGVVAIRTIPKGIDPFKNCDPFGDVLKISREELEVYPAPEEAKNMVRDYCPLQGDTYFVPNYGIDAVDKSYFLNHSRTPNLVTKRGGEKFITAREIKKGEELTADYRLYDRGKSFKL